MKKTNRIISIFLAVLLLMNMTFPAYAAEEQKNAAEKEENIYITMSADGAVRDIYVVNIFPGGDIEDYGSYTSVKLLNTTDEVTQDGDTITFSSASDKVYYQGTLAADTEIPWTISIRYFLDGKEYTPDELAGKSGALEIRFSVTENAACYGSFYDDYALQVSFTLDTALCSNISAADATIANVGSDKQLTYTVLPGSGIETAITADVKDFEMDAVSINGIQMNLNIEVDDAELIEQITELLEAIEAVDDGTGEIQDGVSDLQNAADGDLSSGADELQNGAEQLSDGAGELADGGESVSSGASALADGTAELDAGIQSLNTGIAQIQAGLDALDDQSSELTDGSAQIKSALRQLSAALGSVSSSAGELEELVEASSELKQGISDLSNAAQALESNISYESYKAVMLSNGLDIDELLAGNASAVSSLDNAIEQAGSIESKLNQYSNLLSVMGIDAGEYTSMIDEYVALAGQLQTLLNGNTAAIGGMESWLTALNEGASALADGTAALKDSYDQFDTVINTLVNSLTELLYEMADLKDAVNALVEAYSEMDNGLSAYTEGVSQVVTGYSQISDGAASLVSGSATLTSGSNTLYDGTAELLNGILELYEAAGVLTDGTGELNEGVAELADGIARLYDGTSELKDGTGELRSETNGMDTEIENTIDELLDSFTGSGDAVSFVSEKNINVKSVQFVMQTDAIQLTEVEEVTQPEEELSFWQKLLNLFGFTAKKL